MKYKEYYHTVVIEYLLAIFRDLYYDHFIDKDTWPLGHRSQVTLLMSGEVGRRSRSL